MKKILSLALLLVMLFSLVACTTPAPIPSNQELWEKAQSALSVKDANNMQFSANADLKMGEESVDTSTTVQVKDEKFYMNIVSFEEEINVWYADGYAYMSAEYMGEIIKQKMPASLDEIMSIFSVDFTAEIINIVPSEKELQDATVEKTLGRTIMTITLNAENHEELSYVVGDEDITSATMILAYNPRYELITYELLLDFTTDDGYSEEPISASYYMLYDVTYLNQPQDVKLPDDLDTYLEEEY